jgi:hypothetical protein
MEAKRMRWIGTRGRHPAVRVTAEFPVLFRRSAATTRSMASVARSREVPRVLLSRREAADALGMSLRHFQRHVQPYLRCVYSGQLRLYPLKDLERWVEEQGCREGTAA